MLSQHALQVVSQHALQQVSRGVSAPWGGGVCSRGCLLLGDLLWGVSAPRGGVCYGGCLVWGGLAFWFGGLLVDSGLLVWCLLIEGSLLVESGLLFWLSGVIFCYGLLVLGVSPNSRHPPSPRIWSMSGRYASYWNAFLF